MNQFICTKQICLDKESQRPASRGNSTLEYSLKYFSIDIVLVPYCMLHFLLKSSFSLLLVYECLCEIFHSSTIINAATHIECHIQGQSFTGCRLLQKCVIQPIRQVLRAASEKSVFLIGKNSGSESSSVMGLNKEARQLAL